MSIINDINILMTIISMIIIKVSALSYNQPKFCPSATWDPDAITLADKNIIGDAPRAIFVDSNNTVYVGSYTRSDILIWQNDSIHPTRPVFNTTLHSASIFVSRDSDIYVAIDVANGSVYKWKSNANVTISTTLNLHCLGLFIDTNDTLYCSAIRLNQVVKKGLSDNANKWSVAAGANASGPTANTLNFPHGIFVDVNFDLYVADWGNHRIQLFRSGELNGITVAGTGSLNATIILKEPTGIVLDADKHLFIADFGNHRIVASTSYGFRCLVGCSAGNGSASYQLTHPNSLSFDSFGNMYVADRDNHRIQKFLLSTNSCTPSYNQPKFCPSATWNSSAITFANHTTIGNQSYSIFIDSNNTVYVANREHHQINIWKDDRTHIIRAVSDDLLSPVSIFVTANGDIYVDNNTTRHRIDKFKLNSNISTPVMYINSSCYGLFVDNNNTLYCSMLHRHQVVKRYLSDNVNTSLIAAGTGVSGPASNMLSSPHGIFVDDDINLYVADCDNNRIQFFRSNQLNGSTIAGNQTLNFTFTLDCPTGIVLDIDKYLFIVDHRGNRIIGSSSIGFRCLVGCSRSAGSGANELDAPYSLCFDSRGNMFITDKNNYRIQKFLLSTNSCNETMTSQATSISSESYVTSSTALTTHNLETNSFILPTCNDSTRIGLSCNMSKSSCKMLNPCQNDGTCQDNETEPNGNLCLCLNGFNGTRCQFDYRPSKLMSCWNDATYEELSNECVCKAGWEGKHCERKINYCENITCKNNGVCRPLFRNYTCECVSESFSGRHCEITGTKIKIYKIVSKTFAYIAIIALIIVAMFVIIMDILKYCFGIDPVHEERERIRREKRKPVIQRFIYVNAPEQPTSDITETLT